MGLCSEQSAPAAGRAGEPRAVAEQLEQRLFALVYRQMVSLVGKDRAELDDLVQVAAEQVLRSMPSFEGRSQLSTWTYRICYTTLLKHYRFRVRWRRRFRLTRDGELPEIATEHVGAAEALESVERIDRLRAALSMLPPKRRAVVVMRDLEGLELSEIATIVGARHATVKSRLRDGRRILARLLASDPYFGDAACRRALEEP
jgi:RNA polymerase sigma-70 factor (ECF subfamily)